MKKLISILLTVVVAVCCLSFAACGGTKFTYWQTEGKESADGTRLSYVANLSFDSTKVTQIWINVSDLKPDKTTIAIDLKSSSSSTNLAKSFKPDITKSMISESKKNTEGWINIYDGDETSSCGYLTITVTDELKFNEIVLFAKDNKQIKLTFSEGGVKAGSSSESIFNKDKLDSLVEGDLAYNEYPAYNIVDEQDSFPTELLSK